MLDVVIHVLDILHPRINGNEFKQGRIVINIAGLLILP